MSGKTQKKDAKRREKKKAEKARSMVRAAQERNTEKVLERYRACPPRLPAGVPGDLDLPRVLAFCKGLSPGETPLRLVPNLEPSDKANECFFNVKRRIDRDGGDMLCGWAIWEIPGVLIEGEFHGVWRTAAGELIDVSPLATEDAHRTFLPDPALKWEDVQRDNVRRPLVNDPRVAEFIKASEAHYRMLNRGDRKGQFGAVGVDHAEAMAVAVQFAKAAFGVEEMLTDARHSSNVSHP